MNIFENAYFGKPYKTRDGRKALLLAIHTGNISPYIEDALIELLIDNYPLSPSFTMCNAIGQCTDDYHPNESIISEWQEEINIEELEKLAMIEGAKAISHFVNREQSKFAYEWADLVKEAYKAGYRKAKQEQL